MQHFAVARRSTSRQSPPLYAYGASATAAHARPQDSPCCAAAFHPVSAAGASASSPGYAATARPPRNPPDRRHDETRSESCPTAGACSAEPRPRRSGARRYRRPGSQRPLSSSPFQPVPSACVRYAIARHNLCAIRASLRVIPAQLMRYLSNFPVCTLQFLLSCHYNAAHAQTSNKNGLSLRGIPLIF
jgi:hypothetical protein